MKMISLLSIQHGTRASLATLANTGIHQPPLSTPSGHRPLDFGQPAAVVTPSHHRRPLIQPFPPSNNPSSAGQHPRGLHPAPAVPSPPSDDLMWWFRCKFWGIRWFLQPPSVVQVHVAASKCVIPIFLGQQVYALSFSHF